MKMLLTVITVLVLCTNRLVVADDQCTHYQFKEITDGPRYVYCGMSYTGLSCEDIYNNNPETGNKNGY